ncbi:hypothetical protein BUALT_Bualt14G0103000 [Buddleja alternifolia]|uniref:Pyruvate kinase n=1 Tax=Buddleja alternifolia TaxID=168488 RepID=A0AAV6WHU4_9LAMI|nr:hypothetical protein BUALT_Bualt14G0103000 [Buddleja alternifolia]
MNVARIDPPHILISLRGRVVIGTDGEIWTFSVRAFGSALSEHTININYDGFAEDARVGDELLVDGGMVRFEVSEKIGPDVECRCSDPGLLLPRANLTFWHDGSLVREHNAMLPTISSKLDIDFGIAEGVDFIAVSFVKSAEVIKCLKSYIKARARDRKYRPLKNLNEIIEGSDGAMVARGDLDEQTPLEQIPSQQQKIVRLDVSEAVHQQSDALMLSGESAMGQLPEKALTVLRSVSLRSDKQWREEKRRESMELPGVASSFADSISEERCNSAAKMAHNLEVAAILFTPSLVTWHLFYHAANPTTPSLHSPQPHLCADA